MHTARIVHVHVHVHVNMFIDVRNLASSLVSIQAVIMGT